MSPSIARKMLIIASLASFFDWFDFGIFFFFIPIISRVFFSPTDLNSPLFLSSVYVIIFTLPYFMRFLGGIILGVVGDTYGRKPVLLLSMYGIAISSIFFSFLPSFESYSYLGISLLTFLRTIQGFFIGNEIPGIMVYLSEIAPPRSRGFYSSFSISAPLLGSAFAAIILLCAELTLSEDQLFRIGWRIPFIIGSILCFIMLIFRSYLIETPYFNPRSKKDPVLTLVKGYRKHMLLAIAIMIFPCACFYSLYSAFNTYITSFSKYNVIQTTLFTAIFIIVGSIGAFLSGKIQTLVSIRTNLLCSFSLLLLLFVIPVGYPIENSAYTYFGFMWIGGFITGFAFGGLPSFLTSLFPTSIRLTASAFCYGSVNSLFASTTPALSSALIAITLNDSIPYFYLYSLALISMTYVIFMPNISLLHYDEGADIS